MNRQIFDEFSRTRMSPELTEGLVEKLKLYVHMVFAKKIDFFPSEVSVMREGVQTGRVEQPSH